jgi:DNA-binding CsgD family transcriptional regulator
MAGTFQRHEGHSSVALHNARVGESKWRKRFNGPIRPGSADTVGVRVNAAVESLKGLTQREREVLVHLLEHLDDKKVARCLGTSVSTVRNQIASIMDKLSVESRMELIATIVFHSLCD